MIRRPLDAPFHDASLLTDAERAQLLDLQAALAIDPVGPGLGRMNVLMGKATAPAWLATVQPPRPNNHRPAPAPVTDDRRERDRERGSRRERWMNEADDFETVNRMARRGKW